MTLSRRDDLISLFYLMLYLQTKNVPFYDDDVPHSQLKDYIIMKKLALSYEKLCHNFNSSHMVPFAKEIFSIGFKEKPNYSKLRFLLEKNLLDKNMVPNNIYDWNKSKETCQIIEDISDES